MASPYDGLPKERFWKTGVSERDPLQPEGLYRRRFALSTDDRFGTAGSCFAQHISRHLRSSGYHVLDVEPPMPGMREETASRFGYGIYSARYGNIYHVRRLRQLVAEVLGEFEPTDWIWKKGERYVDGLRPNVEPDGFEKRAEVVAMRRNHLHHVRNLFEQMTVFIFTMGLTEGWVHRASGTVFPIAPGTMAGQFDPKAYGFVNFTQSDIVADFVATRDMLKKINPRVRFILTVSPVPLVATADDRHVLVATTYSKSTLRSACGELYDRFEDVDYFPSYELIASPWSRGQFFEPNLRSVTTEGVETVMRMFASEHPPLKPIEPAPPKRRGKREQDLVCEEVLLEEFAR